MVLKHSQTQRNFIRIVGIALGVLLIATIVWLSQEVVPAKETIEKTVTLPQA